VNHHNTLTAGGWLILPQRKGARQRNKPPVNKCSKKPPSKQQVVDYRADLLNLRTAYKLKLPNLTEGGDDQAAAAERQRKNTTQPPDKTTTELLLKYQHQDWILEE
jgi:hypothetical protein